MGGRYLFDQLHNVILDSILLSCSPTDKETIAKLREENELLKGKVKDLEASQVALEARVAAMSAVGSQVSSSSTEEKAAEEKAAPAAAAEAQPSSESAAPVTAETPAADASGASAESKPAEEKPDSEGIELFASTQ